MRKTTLLFLLLFLWPPHSAVAEERFPPPDFRSGYQMPAIQVSPAKATYWIAIDLGALVVALSLAAYLVFRQRSRAGVFLLGVGSLVYFGFWREGCVCPIGSIQNVTLAIFNHGYALPFIVGAYFLLPLAFTLFFGRVFCSAVCPLGAIQDLVLWKPIQVPHWLETALGLFAYAYLGLAALFAATGSDFVICRYDPFVGFFRLSASAEMVLLGAIILLVSIFVGRTYCRFFCPYGVLLRWLSPLSRWRVTISPDKCVDCRLCEQSCPFGAIRQPNREPAKPPTARDRTTLAGLLLLLPVLTAGGAALGWAGANALSGVDATVQKAELVRREEETGQGGGDMVQAFRQSGQSSAELYRQAADVQRKFAIGTPLFGAFLGLVIGAKLIALSRFRRRNEYWADPGTCLACARCFRYCPVEQEPASPDRKGEASR